MDSHRHEQNTIASSNIAANSIFQGNTLNAQRDIYISGSGPRQEPEKSIYDVLAYEGINARAEQLDLPSIPIGSFEWVWTTQFKAWLCGNEPFFWISGKPGSGKSTLVHYLVRTKRTQDLLEEKGTTWVIVDFFFDFRAGKATANDIHGVLRKFLLQLCDKFPSVQARLTENFKNRTVEAAKLSSLIDVFCEVVRNLKSRMCLFVDGLDEFEGDFNVLVETLTVIQDRTGAKVCVASRPESTFLRAFERLPSLKMQDHNSASIRVYIDRAVDKGRDELSDMNSIFDAKLRNEILTRAEGVIVWAKLAIDEILIARRSNMSQMQIQLLLDKLPLDLELMYDRCLSRIRPEHKAEASALLYLLNEFGGELGSAFFSQTWNFICAQSVEAADSMPSFDQVGFVRRISALLGVLIDVLDKNESVRVLHKTLLSYLQKSEKLLSMLSSDFKRRFTPSTKLRLYSAVVIETTQYVVDESHVIEAWPLHGGKFLDPSHQLNILGSSSGKCWETQKLFRFSVWNLPQAIRDMPQLHQGDLTIIQRTMSSMLMLFTLRPASYHVEQQSLALPYIKQQGYLDLWFSIGHGLFSYVRWRLKTVRNERAHFWDLAFVYAITCMLSSPVRRPLSIEHAFFSARNRTAWLLRYYWERFGTESVSLDDIPVVWLQKTLHYSGGRRESPDRDGFLDICELMLSVQCSDINATLGKMRDPYCECGSDHALHEWARLILDHEVLALNQRFSCPDLLTGVLLYCLLKTNFDVNTFCVSNGTAMHHCITQHFEQTNEYVLGTRIAILARLGVDPNVKFKNQTVLDQAKDLYRKAKVKSIATFGRKGNFRDRRLQHVIEILEYQKQHGQWPDFTELEARHPELKHYRVDESGQFSLEDDLIDVFAHRSERDTLIFDDYITYHATPKQKARWINILSRHRNGTIYTDMEPQCKEWLESDKHV